MSSTSDPSTTRLSVNDFLSEEPEYFFAKRGNLAVAQQRPKLLASIGKLANQIRRGGGRVVWIKSVYGGWENETPPKRKPQSKFRGDLPGNSIHHAGTHQGKTPCCVRGTQGASLHPDAAAMVQTRDIVIEKRWYSAFAETMLDDLLRQLGVTTLVFTGLTTNNCVASTVRDAYHLGHYCHFEQCWHSSTGTFQASGNREEALAILLIHSDLQPAPVYTNSVSAASSGLSFDGRERLSGLGAGDSLLIPNFLPENEARELLERLLPDGSNESSTASEIDWQRLTNVRYQSRLPWLTAYQANRNEHGHFPAYRCADPQPWHGQYETKFWTDSVNMLRELVESQACHGFNWSRILCYRDGNDSMGFHSDKCLDLRYGSSIASVSLGEEREYCVKPNDKTACSRNKQLFCITIRYSFWGLKLIDISSNPFERSLARTALTSR